MPRHRRLLLLDAHAEQNALHDVELPVRPGRQVLGQVLAEQPLVEERLVFLVGERGLDDLVEELRSFL